MQWYQTNLQVHMIFLSLGVLGDDTTRLIGILDLPGSRGRYGKNNLRKIDRTVGTIVH